MTSPIAYSDAVATIALVFSVIAFAMTWRLNRSQFKLNERQLERDKQDEREAKKANLGADLITLGRDRYRVKIWNKGPAAARNINLSFPEGDNICDERDMESKLPMEHLGKHDSLDLVAFPPVAIGQSQRKFHAELSWDDDHADSRTKSIFLTL